MDRQIPRPRQRDPGFARAYLQETRRMHEGAPPAPPQRDEAVLLPVLLLLLHEGADRTLLLALAYILLG